MKTTNRKQARRGRLITPVQAEDEVLSDYMKMVNDPSVRIIPKELHPDYPPGTKLIWGKSDGDAPEGWTLHDDGMRYIERDA